MTLKSASTGGSNSRTGRPRPASPASPPSTDDGDSNESSFGENGSSDGDDDSGARKPAKRRRVGAARAPPSRSSSPAGSDSDASRSSRDLASREASETVVSLVRTVLARDASDRYVRRDHLLEVSRGTRLGEVLPQAQEILGRVYGVALEQTEKDKKTSPWVVVNCMSDRERRVLRRLWGDDYATDNGRGPADDLYLHPKYNKGSLPLNNEALIKAGLALLVVSMVVISENNMTEAAMREALAKFGVSADPNRRVAALNMTMDELLGDLARREYVERTDLGDKRAAEQLYVYRLGRRAAVEFSPLTLFKSVQQIYGDRFADVKDKLVVTLQRCYKVSQEQIGAWATPEPSTLARESE